MGSIEDALRELVRYHARRAAVGVMGELPARLRRVRKEVRALQKALEGLAAQVKALAAAREKGMPVRPAAPEEVRVARFSRRTLSRLRRRFDLTQHDLARLLEVSPATVVAWEAGKSRPRRANMAQIVTLRRMTQPQIDSALGREASPPAFSPSRLKGLRKRLGLTQAGLAAALRVSPASVASWEAGRTAASRQSRVAIGALVSRPAGPALSAAGPEGAPAVWAGPSPAPRMAPAQMTAVRKAAGLSQQELAKHLGVSANSVSNWETGRTVPRKTSLAKLVALAQRVAPAP